MKAISPVRSVRSCYEAVCCLSEQSLAIARGGSSGGGGGGGGGGSSSSSKSPSPLEDPMSLLYDMNDCYSKLRELVPGIPQGSKVSQVEILQHVIDYIFDLQIVLEEQAKKKKKSSSKKKGQKDSGSSGSSGSSNGQEAAEAALLSLQAAELASELCSKDERTHCH